MVLWPQDLTLQLATGGVPFSNKRLGRAEEGSKLMLQKCIDFERFDCKDCIVWVALCVYQREVVWELFGSHGG